jgi:hypothetical protein
MARKSEDIVAVTAIPCPMNDRRDVKGVIRASRIFVMFLRKPS